LIAPHWADQLGGDVVTENVTGGGSVIGGTQVYNADPDGHTMMIWAPSEGLPSQIGQDVGYDMREMSHIGFLTQSPATIIFREEAGIDTWEDMISSMGKLDWATQGVGTMAHVGMLILAELTGDFYPDDVNFVHFDGTGEVLGGLERGEANAFLINTATSGAKVIQAIEGTEMFLVFSNPDNFGGYLNEQGVEVGHWASELDVDGMEQMGRVASMRRFYTGPPDVPNDILRTQRDAFQAIINDDEFLTEAAEAGRPVIDPSDHTAVNDIIQESYELLSSEPYRSTLEEAF
jgi:tripartite-type tricarboxylate transporter receptor subunit TctC